MKLKANSQREGTFSGFFKYVFGSKSTEVQSASNTNNSAPLSVISAEHQESIRIAFRDMLDQKTIVRGLATLYRLRKLPFKELDTTSFPKYSFRTAEIVSDQIPELLPVFLADRRLGSNLCTFQGLMQFLRSCPRSLQHINLIFCHSSVRAMVNTKQKLYELYEFLPFTTGMLLTEFPDILKNTLRSTDDMITFIKLMPNIRQSIVISNRDCLITDENVTEVLKWVPEISDKLLTRYRYIERFANGRQFMKLLEAIPEVIDRMIHPSHIDHHRLNSYIAGNGGLALLKMIQVSPVHTAQLINMPNAQELLKNTGFGNRLIGALQLSGTKGNHDAYLVIAKIYRGELMIPGVKANERKAQEATEKAGHLMQQLTTNPVGAEMIEKLRVDWRQATTIEKRESLEHIKGQLSTIDNGYFPEIKRLLRDHPDMIYEVLSNIKLVPNLYKFKVILFVQDLYNQEVERQHLRSVMSFTKLFMYGLPWIIDADLEKAKNALIIGRDLIKKFNPPEPVKIEQRRMKLQIDELMTSSVTQKDPKEDPKDLKLPKSEDQLVFKNREKSNYDRYCAEVKYYQEMSCEDFRFNAQSSLISRLSMEKISTLYKMVESNEELFDLCQDPRMVEFWDEILDNWWRYNDRYNTLGSSFFLVMGEFLLRRYQEWETKGHAFSPEAAKYLQYAVNRYFSPSASLALHRYYIHRLQDTQMLESDYKDIVRFCDVLARRYWCMGFVLSANLHWAIAKKIGTKHPEYLKNLRLTLQHIICAQRVENDVDSKRIMDDIPTSIATLTAGYFSSYEQAKQSIYEDIKQVCQNSVFASDLSLFYPELDLANENARLFLERLLRDREDRLEKAIHNRAELKKLPVEPPVQIKDYRHALDCYLRSRNYHALAPQLEDTSPEEIDQRRWSL